MIVFYHNNCADGAAAAWAHFHAHRDRKGIEYVPCNYGDHTWRRHDIAGQDIVFVDFSEPREDILEICAKAKSVLVLDHHKTAQAALGDTTWHPTNLTVVFDMDRSGAQLAWDHYHISTVRPYMIDYVADRDLWRFELPKSKDINAYIALFKTNLAEFDVVFRNLEERFDACVSDGRAVMAYQSKIALEQAEKLHVREDAEGRTYGFGNVVNVISDTADTFLNAVCPKAAYCLTYFDIPGEAKRVFSLRSRKGLDVSAIAKRFGGGGHAAAAGFTWRYAILSPVDEKENG